MKKIFLVLVCIVVVGFSVSAVVHLVPNPDTNVPKIDTPNNAVNENTNLVSNPDANAPIIDTPQNDTNEDTSIVAEKFIEVPTISQYPELPTGCESVAATMVLQYYGTNITAGEFVTSWLECSEHFYTANGKLYGPNPNKVFAGNPFTRTSYGCFAGPIVNAINHNSTNCTAKKITDRSLEQLCTEYIAKGKPLLIWATMSMKASSAGNTWYLKNGTAFTWIAGEHCLVLVGYTDGYYFLNDPMSGSTVSYQKNIVEARFAELGSQAVYISPNEI